MSPLRRFSKENIKRTIDYVLALDVVIAFRWFGILRRRSTQQDNTDDSHGGSSGGDSPFPVECHACTQGGVPVFHSTRCGEWEASAGSSLIPIHDRVAQKKTRSSYGSTGYPKWVSGKVMDPRSKRVQSWNRAFLIARGMSLAVDPLFYYALSIGHRGSPCLVIDGGVVAVAAVLRTCVDAVHICHVWLQFRLAYVSRESLVVGCGKLVWDPRAVALHYVCSLKGFWFDAFVILPVPQVVFWFVVPKLIKDEKIKEIMMILLFIFLFQFLPKVYHSISLLRRLQKVTGYVFGSIWWGFGLNLIAYFIASHVAGGCWYILAIERVASCIREQCESNDTCYLSQTCSSSAELCNQLTSPNGTSCGDRVKPYSMCLDMNGPYRYGIYSSALGPISCKSVVVKIFYPIYWGLQSLSQFGNAIEPTSQCKEVLFSIAIVLGGLMLFTWLIGNIQVFLQAVMARKRTRQLRSRDMEWWMKRRQLPSMLRHRVRQYERRRWKSMGGEDEMDLIKDLPEGLRRDIKRFLCLDLLKKGPLFHSLDDLILDHICDRVKPLLFCRNEKIIREGDPVQRIVFIVRGRVKSCQMLSKGMTSTNTLDSGGFLGDELFSWCLRRPFIDRLPASFATFTCIEPTEAFALSADDLRYITDHFRYKFNNERVRRTVRYYSSNWRTWAAIKIQLAWKLYKLRTMPPVPNRMQDSDIRLRQCAAVFMSIGAHQHLE